MMFVSSLSRLFALSALAAVLIAGPAQAQEQSAPGNLTPEETLAIEQVVRDYLLEHPEVIMQALEVLQERERIAAEARQREAIAAAQSDLLEDPQTPVWGNVDGDVVIVEFFDYRCAYCRRVAPTLHQVIKNDGNIKLVLKEFPILGEASVLAARAALAAARQGKYDALHWKLMLQPGQISEDSIMAMAEEVGLDVDQLKRDMSHPEVEQQIERNHALARRLNITGTPAFVVGDRLIPGAMGQSQLEALVAEMREQQS
jgi:protein-disulfide isomerase